MAQPTLSGAHLRLLELVLNTVCHDKKVPVGYFGSYQRFLISRGKKPLPTDNEPFSAHLFFDGPTATWRSSMEDIVQSVKDMLSANGRTDEDGKKVDAFTSEWSKNQCQITWVSDADVGADNKKLKVILKLFAVDIKVAYRYSDVFTFRKRERKFYDPGAPPCYHPELHPDDNVSGVSEKLLKKVGKIVKYGCTEGRHGNPSLASNVPGRFVEGYRSYLNGSLVGPPPDRIDAEIFINTDKKSDKDKEGVSLVVGILTYFASMEGVVMYQPEQESALVKTLMSNAESPDNSTTPKGADQISVIECAWTAVSGGTTTELHDGKPIAVNIKIRIKEVKEMKDVADSDPVVFNWVEDTEGEEPKKSKKRAA